MGMTKTQSLPKTQAAALEILKNAGTELERAAWQNLKANTNAIDALTAKGLVTFETRVFLDKNFFAGPTERQGTFYRVAA